jgi:competence protein ComEC
MVSGSPVRVLALCLALQLVAFPLRAQTLEAQFISVGQGDAALVRCPDARNYLLIDSGDNRYPGSAKRFKAHLDKELAGAGKKIAVAVASHPHADHIGSMQWVLETYAVGTYIDSGAKNEVATWSKLDKSVKKRVKQGKLEYINAKKAGSAEIRFCPDFGVTLEFFSPWAFANLADTNDKSVVVRLTHRNVSFLFVGDAEAHAEAVMLDKLDAATRKKLDADILKVGHHGSDTSSTARFVMAVSPQLAIISSGEKEVGTNARYKHPRMSTIDTFTTWFANADKANQPAKHPPNGKLWAYDKGKKAWRQHDRPKGLWLTVQDGTILVRSDGSKFDVAFE